MKRYIIVFILTLITLHLFSQGFLPPRIDTTIKALSELDEFYPRFEGSRAEKEVIKYIEKKLNNLDLDYTKYNFTASDSFHSFSESLRVIIEGNKKDSIIFIIPLNHPLGVKKENSGLINIALALTLIEYYSAKKPPVTLHFVFLGAEYGSGKNYPLGSSLYLDDFFPDFPVMILYLAFKNIPKRIIVGGAGQGIITPYWFTIRCSEALKEAEMPFLIIGNKNQIYRLGLAKEKTSIEPYLQAGYPSISLSSSDGGGKDLSETRKKDWIFSFCSFVEILIQKSKNEIPEYWDHHYLFFQIYNFYLIIKENILLILFIAVFGAGIIYALFSFKKIMSNLRRLIKNIWVIPLILITIFVLLLLSTFTIYGILQLRNDFALWEAYPFLFLLLKVSLATLFFIFCLKLLWVIPIPMTRRFFSTLTIFSLLINIFFISVINISFVYYFVWAFVFIFFAFIFKNRIIRLILFLPAPYWIIKLILDFFIFIPEPVFCHTVLFSLLKGNILISMFLLPFICLIVHIFLSFFPARHKRSRVQYNTITLILLFSNLVLVLSVFLIPHFSENYPQAVTARNVVDFEKQTNQIEIRSSSPLGYFNIQDEYSDFHFDTISRKYIIPRKNIPDLLTIKTEKRTFLDRNNVTVTILPSGTPYKIYFQIHADTEFTLYDSNFPFTKMENSDDYEILIGVYPPSPLEIQLTLPKEYSYIFTIQIDYLDIPFRFITSGKNKKITTLLTLKEKILLKEN